MPKHPKPAIPARARMAGGAGSGHQKERRERFAIMCATAARTPARRVSSHDLIKMRPHEIDGAIPSGKRDRAVLSTRVAVHPVLFRLSALFSALLVSCALDRYAGLRARLKGLKHDAIFVGKLGELIELGGTDIGIDLERQPDFPKTHRHVSAHAKRAAKVDIALG